MERTAFRHGNNRAARAATVTSPARSVIRSRAWRIHDERENLEAGRPIGASFSTQRSSAHWVLESRLQLWRSPSMSTSSTSRNEAEIVHFAGSQHGADVPCELRCDVVDGRGARIGFAPTAAIRPLKSLAPRREAESDGGLSCLLEGGFSTWSTPSEYSAAREPY